MKEQFSQNVYRIQGCALIPVHYDTEVKDIVKDMVWIMVIR